MVNKAYQKSKFYLSCFFLLLFHYCATIYGEIKVFKTPEVMRMTEGFYPPSPS